MPSKLFTWYFRSVESSKPALLFKVYQTIYPNDLLLITILILLSVY